MIRKNLYRFIILFVFVCFICLFTGCKNSMNVQTKYVYDDTNYKFVSIFCNNFVKFVKKCIGKLKISKI